MNCPNKYPKEDIIKNFGKEEFDKNCKNCDNYVYDNGIAYCKYVYQLNSDELDKLYSATVAPLLSKIPKELLFNKRNK